MSQVQLVDKPIPKPANATLATLSFYLLLVFVPIVLKLASLSRIATWSWWRVTALLWVPWCLLLVVSALGWLVHLVAPRPGRE